MKRATSNPACTHAPRLITVLIATLGAGAASAQPAAPMQLEEMVVTAQKREQSLQDVPLAVSALSGDAMRAAGITDVRDLARQVPSLQVQSNIGPLATNYRIRRVGNLGNIPTFEPAVGVFQDGAFRNRPVFSAGDMFDVERVEVLRGPQSTLYGKNTTAGVLAVYTRAPAASFEGSADFSAGVVEGASDAAQYRFVGGISGPLSETVGASLGVSYNSNDHTAESALAVDNDDANDMDRKSLRGQLQWTPSDALGIRLIGGVMEEQDDSVQADIYIEPGSGAATAGTILRSVGLAQACASNDSRDFKHCSRTAQYTDVDAREATLLIDYALDNGLSITSVSSWDWFRFEGEQDDVVQLASPLMKFHDTQEGESWQQELRLTSPGGETVDWLVGAFWYRNEFERGDNGKRPIFLEDSYSHELVPSLLLRQLFIQQGLPPTIPAVPFAVAGQNGLFAGNLDTDYLGLFGQATWNMTEQFSVTAGLRWQTEEKDASISQAVTVPGFSLLSANLLPAAISGDLDRDTDEVTWSITPQFFVNDDLTLYATAAHGFKSGGFNVGWGTVALANREFADEDIMHYEAGVKSKLLDGRMQLAMSAFYTEYKDYQDAAFVSQQFLVGNAEKAELKGVEAEGKVLLGEHFSTDFGISYADLSYDKYTSGLCYPGRTPDNAVTGSCDLSGEHPVNAPEWTTHLGLLWETDVSWGDVYARADWAWSDDYNTSFSADPRLVQDSYDWLSLRVGTHVDRVEVVAWVDNALDEDVVNFDSQLNLFGSDKSYQTYRQAPRSYGVTLRVDF